MAVRSYDRKFIALDQLETALELWARQDSYFSIITLSGAAEEILGRCVKDAGLDTSLDSIMSDCEAMYRHLFTEEAKAKTFADRANYARNQSKHFGLAASPALEVDAREEAWDLLRRAIENYWRLERSLTPAMTRFEEGVPAA